MKSTFAIALPIVAVATALADAHSHMHHIRAPVQAMPKELPKAQSFRSHGCFSDAPNTTEANVDNKFLSSGSCNKACSDLGQAVSAISPDKCFCGMQYPPDSSEIDLAKCNYPCNGYDLEACGGLENAYSIFNTGIKLVPDTYQGPSSSTSSSTSSPTSTSSTSASPSQSQPADGTQKPSGPNVAGIAAGVVVGVVLVAAIIGVIVFFMRRRRNAEIEEEHRRNAAVNAFISGSKPPSTSGGISITDSRLDPVMAHRRLSDGSIADNQDYSRKILRVTNA